MQLHLEDAAGETLPEGALVSLLHDTLRAEINRVLMDGDFTPATCSAVMRLAEAARDFIRAQSCDSWA